MKKLDAAVIALVIALSLLPLVFFGRGRAETVTVAQHGDILYRGPLSRDQLICADGCIIRISGGYATMQQADCPDGLCLRAGNATPVHPVICLPNEVVISVSQQEESLDGIAY